MIYERIKLGEGKLDKIESLEKVVERGGNGNFNLSGLLPWSTYRIRITAFNVFDWKKLKSQFTDAFTVSTNVAGKLFTCFQPFSISLLEPLNWLIIE